MPAGKAGISFIIIFNQFNNTLIIINIIKLFYLYSILDDDESWSINNNQIVTSMYLHDRELN